VERRPGQYVGGVGTACVVVGATILVVSLPVYGRGIYGSKLLFACTLLVISGLLLRIEAAVWLSGRTGPAPDSDG
jgi:hypothetical protein